MTANKQNKTIEVTMDHQTQITNLRCEFQDRPEGIDVLKPRLSWQLESNRRGARQVAYRIRVTASVHNVRIGEDYYWDSGRIESSQSAGVEYDGPSLQSRMECYWSVAVWDELGSETTSNESHWSMGILEKENWSARWISHDPEIIRRDPDAIEGSSVQPGSVPLFRKSFQFPDRVRSAKLYASACGLLDLRINGSCIEYNDLAPDWTDYNKRIQYNTINVTNILNEGENVIGVQLGDGWWSGFVGWQETRGQYGSLVNSMLIQLEVVLENYEVITIVSDSSWRCETGPILYSDFMMGELYDARRERKGWDNIGFDETGWVNAVEVAPPKVHIPRFGFSNNVECDTDEPLELVAQKTKPPIADCGLQADSMFEIAPGVGIYHFDSNVAGWIRIHVKGPAGSRIQIRHAERLNPDGTLYTDNLRRAVSTDTYILRGDEDGEVWKPRFTFHGFQYVEISGLDEPLPVEDVIRCELTSLDIFKGGRFESSHKLVNELFLNAWNSQQANFISVPTDCPQRDERLGWMGDAQVFCRTAMYNMDCAAFFTKWMIDVEDSQDVDGIFPDVAPRLREGSNFVGLDGLGGGPGWADAGVIIPWTMWRMYGDTRVIERHFSAMVRWMDWLDRVNPDAIRCNHLNNNYGDWLCIPSDREFRTQSPMKTLLATAFWAHDADLMARMARAIGRTAEAERFAATFARVRDAFQREWLLEDGRLAVETQTAYLLALDFKLLPESVRARAAEHLVENIRNLDWHLSTGFIGIRHLNPILTEYGHADVAYRLLLNEDYPSWLYPVKHGATTIWERWNGWTAEDGFFDPTMNSFNHYSLGSVAEWLYRHVAGIELDPEVNAFKRFVIKPYVGGSLTWAEGEYASIHGTIQSRWDLQGDTVRLAVTVPPNTSARVYVPCDADAEVRERGMPAGESECVTPLGREGDWAVFEVLAGRYHFTAKYSNPIGVAGRDGK